MPLGRIAIVTLLLATWEVAASPGVIVRRVVGGDELSAPARVGSAGGVECPDGLRRPSLGDEVHLLLAERMARRDEPGLSVVLDLAREKVLVLHHATRTYSELRHPPRAGDLHSPFRRNMGPSAAELYPFVLEGPVAERPGTAGDRPVVVRAGTVESRLLGRLEVEIELLAASAAGALGQQLESLTQRLRNEGEAWLPSIVEGDGLPLALREVLHQPASKVEVVERFESLEEADLPAARFTAPSDYRKVAHRPLCF
ncbi:MAG TPA: hypothetical protein VM617_04695 [Thermoanaerobaculia bacterium]|nr:hypothetical protein [Thermoanaerobaculia bacterium]